MSQCMSSEEGLLNTGSFLLVAEVEGNHASNNTDETGSDASSDGVGLFLGGSLGKDNSLSRVLLQELGLDVADDTLDDVFNLVLGLRTEVSGLVEPLLVLLSAEALDLLIKLAVNSLGDVANLLESLAKINEGGHEPLLSSTLHILKRGAIVNHSQVGEVDLTFSRLTVAVRVFRDNITERAGVNRHSSLVGLLKHSLFLGILKDLRSSAEKLAKRGTTNSDLVEDVLESLLSGGLFSIAALPIESVEIGIVGLNSLLKLLSDLLTENLGFLVEFVLPVLKIVKGGSLLLEDLSNVIGKLVEKLSLILLKLANRFVDSFKLGQSHVDVEKLITAEVDLGRVGGSSGVFLGASDSSDEGKSESLHGYG